MKSSKINKIHVLRNNLPWVDYRKYDKETNTRQVSGLMRVPIGQESNPNAIYGTRMQENAINLIAELAIRGEHSADDIISGKVDVSEFNLYKKCFI